MEEDEQLNKTYMVVYCDGGCRPYDQQPGIGIGYAGSGVHGYLYKEDTISKPNGDVPKNTFITTEGYVNSDGAKKEDYTHVLPTEYFDIVSSLPYGVTSNKAELNAVLKALEYAIRTDAINIIIYTDSQYVITMVNKLLNNDSSVLTPDTPNNDVLQSIFVTIPLGVKIDIRKIKGHSNELGNELADRLATIGCAFSFQKDYETKENIVVKKKGVNYWSVDRPHPLLDFKQLFFVNTDEVTNYYAIMNYSTGDDIGLKTHSALFGIVMLKEPIATINSAIKTYQKNLKPGDEGIVSCIDLNNLYDRHSNYFYNLYGSSSTRYNSNNRHLYSIFHKPLVYTIQPAILAVQTFEKMDILYSLLSDYLNQKVNKQVTYVDITQDVYALDKKGRPTCILDNGCNMLEISPEVNDELLTIKLDLGKELLTRNQLKKLEKSNPRVVLAVKRTDEKVYRYYTIVDTDEGIGIYCNFYSSILLPNEKNVKKRKK